MIRTKKRKKVHNQHTNKYKVEQIEKINKHEERTYKRQNKEKICKDLPKRKNKEREIVNITGVARLFFLRAKFNQNIVLRAAKKFFWLVFLKV